MPRDSSQKPSFTMLPAEDREVLASELADDHELVRTQIERALSVAHAVNER